MKYNTFTLDNGLRIIHRPTDSPVMYCGYQINVGSRDETAAEEGMAHFCEHATFKGTERRRAWHIINRLETVGGDLNAFTNKEDTVYHAAVLKEHTARAVDLLTDIVFHSTYPQHEIEKEVEVICDEIDSYNDSPSELIYDDFENAVFHGHGLGHNILGTADSVRSFTGQDALNFTRRFYVPQNAVFFAYGDIDFGRLTKLLMRTFGVGGHEGHRPPTAPATRAAAHLQQAPYCPADTVVDRHTHQAHVMMGNRAYGMHHPHRTALYLLNNLLGGPGMTARLNLSLRERNGLVYSVDSSMATYGETGIWAVYFGCDPHDVKRCRRLVCRELDRLMQHPLNPARLAAAKKQMKGQIGVACDNRESFALDFGKTFLHYGVEKDITAFYKRIDAVTATEIQTVAQHIFNPAKLSVLTYL